MEKFQIHKVPPMSAAEIEQLGTKQKFWYYNGDDKLLYKIGYKYSGEHWAEKVASELCKLMGIPHAHYELAEYNNTIGVISETFVPTGCRLVLGNELLSIFNQYDKLKRYKQKDYTMVSVLAVMKLNGLKAPLGFYKTNQINTPLGVFIGYLLLDALIANQDRHHENWGLILNPKSGLFLAPSYDHASSMARNVTDNEKEERLNTKDKRRHISNFLLKAKSPFYSTVTSKQLSTFDAFATASKKDTMATVSWLKRLKRISSQSFSDLFMMIPDALITETTRIFAIKLLELNRLRLLNLIG